MLIDIDKIIVKDRIRKDFGDIHELAEDIKLNGLINPPVVNKEYELLAGERRLKACKALGWNQIEVRMMDTRDAEHELNVEISENENRKEFSKSERVDYMKRLLRIEQAKAKERMSESGGNISTPQGKARDLTAEQFGISGKQMEKEISIVENKHLISAEDFADWDEGKLSTNKVFKKIKGELEAQKLENEALRADNKILANRVKPEVVEKEVIKEVVPDDYEEAKKSAEKWEQYYKESVSDNQKIKDENRELKRQIRELQEPTTEQKIVSNAKEEMEYFIVATYEYIRKYGGKVWAFDKYKDAPVDTQRNFQKAIQQLSAFSQQLVNNLGGIEA